MKNENWLPVVGFEGLYEVSDYGNVKRCDWRGLGVDRPLKASTLPNGYLRVTLFKYCVRYYCSIHRLVAAAFIGPCPDGKQVDHKDADKENNTPENLQYVTGRENRRLGIRRRLASKGRAKIDGKLNLDDVLEIRKLLHEGVSVSVIARKYGLAQPFVSQIKSGVKWATI